jgi:hypothetical protein
VVVVANVLFVVLEIKPRAFCMLATHSTTELCPHPLTWEHRINSILSRSQCLRVDCSIETNLGSVFPLICE